MIRAVIDTNILVSALITKEQSPPVTIYEAFKAQRFILVTSSAILAELEDVMNREHIVKLHKLEREDRETIVKEIVVLGVTTTGKREVTVSSDLDDNMFLSAAVEGKADYIVTGDKGHLLPLKEYEGIKIITAREFIELLNKRGDNKERKA